MADDIGGKLGRLWRGLKDKTTETVARQEAAFVRGKVAATAVSDGAGNVIVEAGHRIDDRVIQRAEAAGKLHALTLAVSSAQVQDLKEKARESYGSSVDGREAHAVNTIEEFAEARRYVGQRIGMDVTDVRGNVIIAAGKKLDDADVRLAREANLLSALIFAAQQAPPPEAETAAPAAAESDYKSTATQTPIRRGSLPLVKPEDRAGKGP
jgi:hypothetical protein